MNLARAKSKAIKNRAAADGQTAIIRAWGGASASRNPLVPWKGDGGFCASVLQMHCLLVLYQIWHNILVIPKILLYQKRRKARQQQDFSH